MTTTARWLLRLLGCLLVVAEALPLEGQEREWIADAPVGWESVGVGGWTEVQTSPGGESLRLYDFRKDYRAQWSSGSGHERGLLSKRIGDQGAAWWARQHGLKRLCGATGRNIPQGIDGVYWDPVAGKTFAVEAKGGWSRLSRNYGVLQGTNEYSIQAARRVLRSRKTRLQEKVAHARVLLAARDGRLGSVVLRTKNVLGQPSEPYATAPDATSVRLEASAMIRELERNPVAASALRMGRAEARFDMGKVRLTQGMRLLGTAAAVGGAAVTGREAYLETLEALDAMERLGHGRMTAFVAAATTGRAALRWTSAWTLALAPAQLVRGLPAGLRGVGRAAGKSFLPVAVGVEFLDAGLTLYEYSEGTMTWGDFCRRIAGPSVFAGSVAVGAGIGAFVGAFAGGVGAGPGAYLGGNAGALAAIPLQNVVDWWWSDYFEELDVRSYRAMASALAQHYQSLE